MLGLHLGLRTVAGHRRSALLAALMLAGMLAPILILWGLKSGAIDALSDRLRNDPRNLEVRLVGDNLLGPAELSEISALDGVGFLQPTTRALAARAFLSRGSSGREAAALMPSALGDPLLARDELPVPGPDEIVLSEASARATGSSVGEAIQVSTRREDGSGRLSVSLTVIGILDAGLAGGARAFVDPSLLEEIEAFLDGFEVPRLQIAGRPLSDRRLVHASVRLYAQDIQSVPVLAEGLQKLGYNVLSRASDIERLVALGAGLDNLIAAIAALLVVGYGAAAGANITAVFDRQTRNIALLRLMGAGRSTILLFVVGFGLATGAAGYAAALGLFAAACSGINAWLPLDFTAGRPSCALAASQLSTAGALTLLVVLLVTFATARRFAAVPPAGALRAD